LILRRLVLVARIRFSISAFEFFRICRFRKMSDREILIKVEGVSRKFCRGFKRSLWYGLKDVAHELNPFAREAQSPLRLDRGESDATLAHQMGEG